MVGEEKISVIRTNDVCDDWKGCSGKRGSVPWDSAGLYCGTVIYLNCVLVAYSDLHE